MLTLAVLIVGVMAGVLIYALFNAPRRYRRFGPGQAQEAVDNSQGIFGRSYPEDRAGLGRTSEPQNRENS